MLYIPAVIPNIGLSSNCGETATVMASTTFWIPDSIPIVTFCFCFSLNSPPKQYPKISKIVLSKKTLKHIDKTASSGRVCFEMNSSIPVKPNRIIRTSKIAMTGSLFEQYVGTNFFTNMPVSSGKAVSRLMFKIVAITGKWNLTPPLAKQTSPKLTIKGIVKMVIRLLKAVSVIDRAVSAFARDEKQLDTAPPGQAPKMIKPTASKILSWKIKAIINASRGAMISWTKRPTVICRGDFTTCLKS